MLYTAKEGLPVKKQGNAEVKAALRRFVVMVVSLVLSYGVVYGIFRSENFWITIAVASVVSTVVELLWNKRKSA